MSIEASREHYQLLMTNDSIDCRIIGIHQTVKKNSNNSFST